MTTAGDPFELLTQAEAAKQVSPTACANIHRWLTEPPFVRYRPRLIQDIQAGRWQVLDDAFYAVLEFGTGGRRGKMYPVGTNVLNDRTMSESARGLADAVIARKGAGAAVVVRDRARHPTQFPRVRGALRAGPGRGRLPRLPLRRAEVDPPALLRRPPSGVATRGS